MNRSELISEVARNTGYRKKDVSEIIDAYETSILDAISRGENVLLHDFMRIERKMKKAHAAYDFENKRPIIVKESECVKIRPGTMFAECLNGSGE